MSSDDDRQILDPEALDPYTGGDRAVTLVFYRKFFTQTKNDAATLRAALDKSDVEAVTSAAHRIRGSSLLIGAVRQAGVAERIERACREGAFPSARAAREDFEREHKLLIDRLAPMVGDDSAPST